jgi:cohesin complex subunit SA-1/2
VSEYPLISKVKQNPPFRKTMTQFVEAVIQNAHANGILYTDLALIENIQVWVTTMSSSSIRPFRHTSTVVSLSIVSELCDIATGVAESTATSLRQKEAEAKKKGANKARVAALQEKVDEGNTQKEAAESTIKDIFDTVFVHRYRDVDPKIRIDCIKALGQWIATLPEIFFEGQYLRYLGWVLSDTEAHTRSEVISQLHKLFKDADKVGGLRHFTERFRPRLVEMASQDADASVRAATVGLLDTIREAGLLEPDDIETIGRLIFDSEPRVRKAVLNFFVEIVNEQYEGKLEELGGEEAVEEVLGEESNEIFDTPRIAWLKYKCLVETLKDYSSTAENEDDVFENGAGGAKDALVAAGVESRFSLATLSLFEKMSELQEWEALAGYLLFDHSATKRGRKKDDVETQLKLECKLDEEEEIILLEALNASVKLSLSSPEQDRAKNKKRASSVEDTELVARHLAQTIPKLLNKFGPVPDAASAVLRLEHVLNLEIFQELRQDDTGYASLLDNINHQFLSHADQGVLAEASAALLHGKGFDDLEEVTEGKVQALWEDSAARLTALSLLGVDRIAGTRLKELANTVRRLSNLATISNCTEVFENIPKPAKSAKGKAPDPFHILLAVIGRPESVGEDAELEDGLVIDAIKSVFFYFMWKVQAIQSSGGIAGDLDIDDLATRQVAVIGKLGQIMEIRTGIDNVRLTGAGVLLDVFTLFATLRGQNDESNELSRLVLEVSPKIQASLTFIYMQLEKTYGKKTGRRLEAAEDDAPEDDEDDEDEEEGDSLLLEQQLCELAGKIVLAIISQVVDTGALQGKLRERLTRNKNKLGANFKEVVNFLEEPKKKKQVKKPEATNSKSKEVVEEDEEMEDIELEEGGEADLVARELDVPPEAEEDSPESEVGAALDEEDDEIMGD